MNDLLFVTSDWLGEYPREPVPSPPLLLSVLLPETPIREGEPFVRWLYRAQFRYEMMGHLLAFVLGLSFCWDGTYCVDDAARMSTCAKLIQICARVCHPLAERETVIPWQRGSMVMAMVALTVQLGMTRSGIVMPWSSDVA